MLGGSGFWARFRFYRRIFLLEISIQLYWPGNRGQATSGLLQFVLIRARSTHIHQLEHKINTRNHTLVYRIKIELLRHPVRINPARDPSLLHPTPAFSWLPCLSEATYFWRTKKRSKCLS